MVHNGCVWLAGGRFCGTDAGFAAPADVGLVAGDGGPSWAGEVARDCRRPGGNRNLWVPETLHTSCDLLIFVEESAKPVASSDVADLGCCAVRERL